MSWIGLTVKAHEVDGMVIYPPSRPSSTVLSMFQIVIVRTNWMNIKTASSAAG